MTQLLTCYWLDSGDRRSATHYHLVDGADPAALLAALQAHSNAGLQEWAIGQAHVVNGATQGGPFDTLNDLAELRYCTASGPCTTVFVAAPKIAVFFGGSSEVDPGQISDLMAAALGTLADITGEPVVRYATGWRKTRRTEQ